MKYLVLLIMVISVAGCVRTRVIKEVQIHRDANGKLIKTVDVERAEQIGAMKPISIDYLKVQQNGCENPYHSSLKN